MSNTPQEQTGARIRDRRIDQAMRQADLAKAVGISPSYLNLIEHNKRRIAGTLLSDIAQALDIRPALLTEGAERAVLDQMRDAAAVTGVDAEIGKIEDMAARYPGWANVIAAQAQDRAALWARTQELTDRMAHDPVLSTSLHAVISAVTSIRSTASILTSDETLDADWLQRFHRNIHEDARRLAESSQALMHFLDAPDATPNETLNPFVEVEAYMAAKGNDLSALQGDVDLEKLSVPAQELLRNQMAQSLRLDSAMPLDRFVPAAIDTGYDPDRLAQMFNVSLVDAMRQLARLPQDQDHPPIGLVECDASGAISYLKSTSNFTMSRAGLACPMWPLFTALGQPGRPVRRDIVMPDHAARPMRCTAIAEQTLGVGGDRPPVIRATMIVLTEPAVGDIDPLPIGPSCRICPRENCAARREPSALSRNLL